MTSKNRDDTGNWKKKLQNSLWKRQWTFR